MQSTQDPRAGKDQDQTPEGEAEAHTREADDFAHQDPGADEIAGDPPSEEAIAKLIDENAELKDRLLRAVAEAENVRRRSAKEKADASKFGISSFARDLMSVADNFSRALDSLDDDIRESGGETVKNLITGIEMVERELLSAFEKNGIAQVCPVSGDKFDPNLHQAIAEIPVDNQPSGTVVEATQIGYLLDDRLLRPAMVVVARNAGGGGGPQQGGDPDAQDPGANVNTTV